VLVASTVCSPNSSASAGGSSRCQYTVWFIVPSPSAAARPITIPRNEPLTAGLPEARHAADRAANNLPWYGQSVAEVRRVERGWSRPARHSDGSVIAISAAGRDGEQITHVIHAPTSVRTERTNDGVAEAMQIESATVDAVARR